MFNKIKSQEQAYKELKACKNYSELGKFMKRYQKFIAKNSAADLAKESETYARIHHALLGVYKQASYHKCALQFLEDYADIMIKSFDKKLRPPSQVVSDIVSFNANLLDQCKTYNHANPYLQYTSLIINLADKHGLKIDTAPCDRMARFGQNMMDQADQYPTAIETSRALNNLAISVANLGRPVEGLDIAKNLNFLREIRPSAPQKFHDGLDREITRTREVQETYNLIAPKKPAKKEVKQDNTPQGPTIRKLKR